ncbi:methyl-accepting chemotaxis protein [Paenibacillus agricola]|uniref:Methyl-accepting chemotaxis protein n=1 Tax=Paenibacillus agricola TaxID=2716264 RepID=A0ABX0J495_9BACL|nr:methyl-accepting chemotaxis protein [Paenibacillus agricola]NHN30468.1 methyl-accepting chemotaxis protein [Paenibacillus agricola]
MNIKKKLAFSFAAVLLLTLIVGVISWIELTTTNKTYETLINDRVQKILQVKDLKYFAANEAKNVRAYLLTGNQKHYESYENDHKQFASIIQQLQPTVLTEQGKELVGKLNQLEQQYTIVVANIAEYKKRNDVAAYTRLVEEECVPLALALADKAEELENYQNSALAMTQIETSNQVESIKSIIVISVILALLLGTVLAYLITQMISRPVIQVANSAKRIAAGDLTVADLDIKQKDEIGEMARAFNDMKNHLRLLLQKINHNALEVAFVSRELSEGSEQSVMASNQIAEAVQQISGSADLQVVKMAENKQAMEESALSLQRIAQSAAITAESSEQAMQQAEQGSRLLGETVGQMRQIHVTIEESASVIYDLGEQSKQIDKITQFIKEIAQQTNLLSLNASIEAARAGEQGRGFAVVASEVKKLAEQTGEASEQIASGIKKMVDTISEAVGVMKKGSVEMQTGTDYMNRTGEAFETVYSAIRNVAGQVQKVSVATEELSVVTDQLVVSEQQLVGMSNGISDHSQSVAAVCEEQLASMEEISASAEALNHMAEELKSEIRRFKFEEVQEVALNEAMPPYGKPQQLGTAFIR